MVPRLHPSVRYATLLVALQCLLAPRAAADPIVLPAANTSNRSPQWTLLGTELSYWNANVWLEYQVDAGAGGSWTLGLTGINKNSASAPGLPPGYAFNIALAIDGISSGSFTVPGSTTAYQTGTTTRTVGPGLHTIRFTWTNDAYNAGNYDANLRVKEVSFTPPAPAVATPVITPPGGTFADAVEVTLTTATPGAEIRYTTDGTIPTTGSVLYVGPVTLTQNATVKAKAFKAGLLDSAPASADFIITTGGPPPTGVIIPAVQTSNRSPQWTLLGTELSYWNANVWLEYQVDAGAGGSWTLGLTGINKNSASAPGLPPGYAFNIALAIDGISSGSFTVPGSTTVYQTGATARTLAPGLHTIRFTWTNDAYSQGHYDTNLRVKDAVFTPPATPAAVATPTITPPGATSPDPVIVSLATATPGAEIRYTLDGSLPGPGALIYTEPFTVTTSSPVTARAFKSGLADSEIAAAIFTILPPPVGEAIVLPAVGTTNRSPQWSALDTELYYWNANVWLEYEVDLPAGGTWQLGFTAINKNSAASPGLPTGYAFLLDVLIDGEFVGSLGVPGSATAYQTGVLTRVLTAGPHTFRFIWINDAYSPGAYDANLRVKEVSFTGEALDTEPPIFSDLATTDLTAFGVTVTWTTDEPATSRVEFGPTATYGQTSPADPTLRTRHRVALVDLPEGLVYFRAHSQDRFGNEAAGSHEQALIPAPDPLNPTLGFTSPPQNALLAPGPVIVTFDTQDFAVADQGQTHFHIYLDGDPTPHHFYNGATQEILRNGVHTHAMHWVNPAAFSLLGLAPGLHQAHCVLADATDQELLPPEARRTLQIVMGTPSAGELSLEPFASGLLFPAFFAFAPDGRAFYTELPTGQVRIVQPDGQLQEAPFYQLNAQPNAGRAVYGIALDPDFTTNGYVYVAYELPGTTPMNRVVRLTDVGGQGMEETTIVAALPSGSIHNVEALHFGPDGKLYISVGDVDDLSAPQDPQALAGKILRYHPDGSIPADNPFPGSPVYVLGLRNSFDFTFHPHTGALWLSENGPESDDEINRGVPGGNYGWPLVTGIVNQPGFIDPLIALTPTIGPTGLIPIPEGPAYPEAFHGNLLWADYNNGKLYRIVLGGAELTELASFSTAYPGGQGFLLSLAQGPDGYLYVSNEQGLFRVVPTSP